MTLTDLDDAALAARLAYEAGQLALDVRAGSGLTGKALGDAGDAAANRLLCDAIRTARPDDGLLSEEEKDDTRRCSQSRVWIVDPVDGTREYGEARADWAVHVALAVDGVASIGAVALPDLEGGVVLRSDQPQALPPMAARPRFLVSRSRPAPEAEAVANALGGELVPMGSAGAKAMAVVRGEAEVYLHSGGQHEWDSCAPVAVALAHGLHCSRIDGSPLVYNQPHTYMPDLLICRAEWAERVLAEVARIAGSH
ncbi:3'(2'), 5'-bisphosphate nucleotidase [Erythromicrobium ramosum]|uniref:3'(2'), 5'-bisphosphate nucleotidase n=1 Tax=Erythrobacter ramosus TaxID=35811 RepID=A0A6I4UI11_9SPHN|nr:3'(2'),5'-bisphosphate nucleotidase CysQ [Erythrobacter ramosus]MBB3775095.1 3'(2'), 5'-bisphosphate nucleotidase [Erythrobacter ramosus]MXP37277.1 3'(2'),5'-bisphosphate nucleotidase CysQ [Erythrobacter ramosus]